MQATLPPAAILTNDRALEHQPPKVQLPKSLDGDRIVYQAVTTVLQTLIDVSDRLAVLAKRRQPHESHIVWVHAPGLNKYMRYALNAKAEAAVRISTMHLLVVMGYTLADEQRAAIKADIQHAFSDLQGARLAVLHRALERYKELKSSEIVDRQAA